MPSSQLIIFTVIPRGVSLNAETLPVSVFISPRLRGEDKLGAYLDWLHWTERRRELGLRITFECQGQTLTVEAPTEQLRPELWDALFNEETLVRSHQFDDYSDRFIASYSVRGALSAIKATYQAAGVGLALPGAEGDPREIDSLRRRLFRSLIDGYDVNWDEASGRRWREEQRDIQRNADPARPSRIDSAAFLRERLGDDGLFKTGLVDPSSPESKQLRQNVVQPFAVFSHMPPGAPLKRESLDEKTVLDFHQALSSLNTYPELQRMLGLVFDLDLPLEFVAATQGETPGELRIVQAEGDWNGNTLTTIPTTSTAYIHETIESGDRIFATAPRYLINNASFTITDLSLVRLRSEGVPNEILDKLQHIKNQFYIGEERFLTRLKAEIGDEKTDRFKSLIFKHARVKDEAPGVFGLLFLDPARFGLAQVDVDGGLHKAIILSETMTQAGSPGPANPQHPEVFDPTTTLPSLRSGGISLFADERALRLLDTFRQSKEFSTAIENNQAQARPFGAEDLVRGFRLDVWEAVTGKWHSLHRRNGIYLIGDRELRTEDEEGFVQLAATQAAPNEDGTRERDDLHLHEAIARWNGWSLSADRPGKHLTRAADPQKAVPDPNDPDPENEPITPFKMTTTYQVVSGSLPRLRFGGRYRLRARAVDLAGNSVKLDDHVTDLLTPGFGLPRREKTFPYLRYDPVVAPFLILRDERGVTGEGSSIDRIVIRTFNSNPSLDGFAADLSAADRHIAPPRGSVELGERHGMFDDANGKLIPSAAMWQLIKQRDEGKFNEVQIDSIVINGEKLSVPLEPGARIDTLPYLPDPLARGAVLRDLPGAQDGTAAQVEPNVGVAEAIPYAKLDDPNPRPGSAALIGFGGRDDWQKVAPFRLALNEGSAPPTWDPDERLLTVFLPKGQTKVVPLSCYMSTEDLKLMGVWQWLREYVEFITEKQPESQFYRSFASKDRIAHILQLAIEGGHWMLTPPHLLTLVHAVQQPLGVPRFSRLNTLIDPQGPPTELQTQPESEQTSETELDVLTAWRKLGSTDAYLVGGLHVHGASTAKVDLRAEWGDPVDDVKDNRPSEQAFSTYVDEVPLNDLNEGYLHASSKDERRVGYYDPDHDLMCFAHGGSLLGNLASGAEIHYDAVPRHQIGDTKHHLILYTAIATSRFREYFPPKDGDNDRDFTRKSEPIAVHVPASARPVAPQVLYVVPTFGWQRETRTNQKRSVRMGGGLRVYMDRPWYSSGVGELLGVALWSGGPEDREEWKPFITQWGQDPIWQSTPLSSYPDTTHFPDAVAKEYNLPLEARLKNGDVRRVNVAGHAVAFDEDRKLWYCDLTVNTKTATYAPFVRLALVRYQPHALVEAKLSRVVLADFSQLTPERAAMVTADPYQPSQLRVVVSGPAPRGPVPESGGNLRPTVQIYRPTFITVTVQERELAMQSDLAWHDAPAGTFDMSVEKNNPSANDADLALWVGSIRFRQRPQPNQYRLLIQEREYVSADYTVLREQEGALVVEQPSRLTYAETILLDEALLDAPPLAASQTIP